MPETFIRSSNKHTKLHEPDNIDLYFEIPKEPDQLFVVLI